MGEIQHAPRLPAHSAERARTAAGQSTRGHGCAARRGARR